MPSAKQHKNIPLTGKFSTHDPLSIGTNFQTLTNMRYTDTHPKSVQGMTKINSSIMNATYFKTRNAFHFEKSQPNESHVLTQSYNTGLTASQVLENTTAIPSAGNFSATALFTDTTGAGRGYFSNAPDGQIAYANGVDTCIWGGTEQRCGAFILSTTALAAQSDTPVNPKHYTDQINNTKTGSNDVVTIGGSYLTFLIGSPRPIKGAKFYVSSANTSANTLTVKESTTGVWNTLTVISDGTRVSGKSFAQSGTISWASTVTTTKPKYLEGYYQYWYQFTLTAGSVEVYYVTLDIPFQNIIDMWDGVYRDISRAYLYTSSQADISTKVLYADYDSTSTATYADISSLVATTQYLEFGFTEKQTGLFFNLPPDYVNSHAAATYAQGTITMTGVATANQTFTIDTQTFTWKAARTGTGEVTIGADAPAAVTNLVTAITADLDTVTAEDSTGDTVLVTSVVSGDAGNSIVFVDVDSSNMAFDGTGTLGATTLGVNGGLASIDYWDGGAYSSVGTVTDGTSTSGVALTKTGVMSWVNANIASEQKKQYADSVPLYYYRVKFDQTLDASVRIDYVGGISASREISYYKFPIFAQGRVLLCCDMSEQKNKVIASGKYTPQVFSGSDSVDIYFGEEGELNCGTELFSQFGSSLYSLVLMFKDNETWIMAGQDISTWNDNIFLLSSSIGCPAPLTLKTINLSAEPGAGINRSLAIWQGTNGVFMSDGRAPIPIHGDIREYFDKTDSRCIKSSMIGDSVGWIDGANQEYHLAIASGTSATTLNTELVYDIIRNRWFVIDRGVDLQCGVLVHDTDGNAYNYGFIDTGYMERLEYGNTFDGTAITSTLRTGDFLPLETVSSETMIDAIKLMTIAKTTTTNTITVTHYGDSKSTGTILRTFAPQKSGYRIAQPETTDNIGGYTFHSLNFSMVTSDETTGFEPIIMGLTYHKMRED